MCYLTGVMRWVGALEVLGPSEDKSRIWKDAEFPIRVNVKPLVMLSPMNGVPMSELEGKVDFFETQHDRGKFKGFVRGSPRVFKKKEDGELILRLLGAAKMFPTPRPIDEKKLARKPWFKAERRRGKETVSTVVSVPEPDESENPDQPDTSTETKASTTRHTEIQYRLFITLFALKPRVNSF